ncbi:hypothetical protein D3C73_1226010 [compost metagenome]
MSLKITILFIRLSLATITSAVTSVAASLISLTLPVISAILVVVLFMFSLLEVRVELILSNKLDSFLKVRAK